MKTISFAVAMLAAISMVVTPVAPSIASEAMENRIPQVVQPSVTKAGTSRQKIAAHAERGEAAILSKAQMDRLAKSNPKLHARLMAAYNNGTVPTLTAGEKKMLTAATRANLASYKAAGDPITLGGAAAITAFGWFAIGLLGIVALFIFLYWVAPHLFRPRTS